MSTYLDTAVPPLWIDGETVTTLGINKMPYLTVKAVRFEPIGIEPPNRIVVRFVEVAQGLILSVRKTIDGIRHLLGDDASRWPGGRVRIVENPNAGGCGEPEMLILAPLAAVPPVGGH